MTLRQRFGRLSVIGTALIVTTPIGGIIPFAIGSVIFGESNLEGDDGMTSFGLAAYLSPAIFGVGFILADLVAGQRDLTGLGESRLKSVLMGAALIGLSMVALGVLSVLAAADDERDANIGGGLLVLVGIAVSIPAAVLLIRHRRQGQPE